MTVSIARQYIEQRSNPDKTEVNLHDERRIISNANRIIELKQRNHFFADKEGNRELIQVYRGRKEGSTLVRFPR